jgi:hypothetical protein
LLYLYSDCCEAPVITIVLKMRLWGELNEFYAAIQMVIQVMQWW